MIRDYAEYIQRNSRVTESGCWEWQKALNFWGYGQAWYQGRNVVAHRVSYMVFKGDIPDGMVVCHECDNRACVNPAHLEIGTQKKNMGDCRARYRSPGQKLRRKDYAEIARLYNEGGLMSTEVAKMYGISAGYVRDIASGRRKAP